MKGALSIANSMRVIVSLSRICGGKHSELWSRYDTDQLESSYARSFIKRRASVDGGSWRRMLNRLERKVGASSAGEGLNSGTNFSRFDMGTGNGTATGTSGA